MKLFNNQTAMDLIMNSSGGFSCSTLARALISKGCTSNIECLVNDCREFCLHLERQGILVKHTQLSCSGDEYFEYVLK